MTPGTGTGPPKGQYGTDRHHEAKAATKVAAFALSSLRMWSPPNYGDARQTSFCLYCGEGTETREHIPSKVLLDEPYPAELPTIGVCGPCNQGHSLDEEYLACLIECANVGSVDPRKMKREKIARILSKKPQLAKRIEAGITRTKENKTFAVEIDRFRDVLIKLARGHLLFEQNEPYLNENPVSFRFSTLESLKPTDRRLFYEPLEISVLPEMGSRALQRILVTGNSTYVPWVIVQSERYRYITPQVGVVLMVLSEYVWCQVVWE